MRFNGVQAVFMGFRGIPGDFRVVTEVLQGAGFGGFPRVSKWLRDFPEVAGVLQGERS